MRRQRTLPISDALMEETTNELRQEDVRDSELLRQAQGGDLDAFEQLYRRHVGAVRALCWRLAADVVETDEMTQEVFFRAWKNLGKLTSGDHFRGWLRRVAVNLRRSGLRTERRRGPMASLEATEWDPPAKGQVPAGLRSDLERAIAGLPPGARDVLVLHDIYGYKHAEISEMLEVAVGTSRAHLHRARQKLQEVLS